MEAVVWSDYICPWCYAGLDRTVLLESLGVRVTPRPFELHPEIPAGGIDLTRAQPGGRTDLLYTRLEVECAAVGLPFRRPDRIPRSRLALETAAVVAEVWPGALAALDRSLFDAHFVRGLAIDDPDVIAGLVEAAGAEVHEVARLVAEGAGVDAVDRSKEEAFDAGATGTPSWLIDGRALIPGLQDRRMFERVVSRLAAQQDPESGERESGIPG